MTIRPVSVLALRLIVGILAVNLASSDLDFGYHDYASFTSILQSYAQKYPTKTYLYSIGKSVQNRDLWVIALADSNPTGHVPLRPEVKYIGIIYKI
jgi:hypothetical protein